MNYLNKDGLTHLWSKIKELLAMKQDALVAGSNITIKDGVISSEANLEEVYVGSTEPVDTDALIWINPNGESTTTLATTEYVDNAVANVQIDLTGYATEEYVQEQISLIEIPDLTPYALKTDIPDSPDMSGFATKEEIPVVPSNISAFVNDKGYLNETQVNSLINTALGVIENGSY